MTRADGPMRGNTGTTTVSPDAVLWMVDDNPADLEISGIVCENLGFPGRFVTFTSGQDALSRLAEIWAQVEDRPDAILLDVNMPRMSGLAVLRAVRQDQRWAQLPIIMFTTSANEEQVARRDGATDYLIKPDMLSGTTAAIRSVIDRYCKSGAGPL